MSRQRADLLLVERGFFASREQARAAILAGKVRAGDRRIEKAGQLVDSDASLVVASKQRFVSRGGEKLLGALEAFSLDVEGMRAVDVGASTGGFTDCLLQSGVHSVLAIDVGYGQLAWEVRTDPRVTVMERTNIRGVEPGSVGAPFDLAVADLSFISLALVLPELAALVRPSGELLALVKPQFEAGKGRVAKRGVVRDPDVHREVLETVIASVGGEGLVLRGLTWSPIKGPEGNIEFWVRASCTGAPVEVDVDAVVAAAHATLGG